MRPFRAGPLALVLAVSLGGCATAIPPVEVTRFHRLESAGPVLSGRYHIVPAAADPAPADAGNAAAPVSGLAWQTYAAGVARQLDRLGAVAGTAPDAPVDFAVSLAVDRIERDGARRRSPVTVGVGGGVGGGGGYSGGGVGLGIGFNLGGGARDQIVTTIAVRIARVQDGQVIWEGRAQTAAGAGTPAAQPGIAADKLAAALFKDFPGQSGVTISVP